MPSPAPLCVFIVLAGLSFSVAAQSVQHCLSPTGELTYTASNCPPGHALVMQQPLKRSAVKSPLAPRSANQAKAARPRPAPVIEKPVDKVQKSITPGGSAKEQKAERRKRPTKYLPNQPTP